MQIVDVSDFREKKRPRYLITEKAIPVHGPPLATLRTETEKTVPTPQFGIGTTLRNGCLRENVFQGPVNSPRWTLRDPILHLSDPNIGTVSPWEFLQRWPGAQFKSGPPLLGFGF